MFQTNSAFIKKLKFKLKAGRPPVQENSEQIKQNKRTQLFLCQ